MYLDEPSIGLHERDTSKLIKTLRATRKRKNTVIVVEHDKETIMALILLLILDQMLENLVEK